MAEVTQGNWVWYWEGSSKQPLEAFDALSLPVDRRVYEPWASGLNIEIELVLLKVEST